MTIPTSEFTLACVADLYDEPVDLPAIIDRIESETASIDVAAVAEFQEAAAEAAHYSRNAGTHGAQVCAADDAARARFVYARAMGRI